MAKDITINVYFAAPLRPYDVSLDYSVVATTDPKKRSNARTAAFCHSISPRETSKYNEHSTSDAMHGGVAIVFMACGQSMEQGKRTVLLHQK